jgi:hypothetical protein
LGANAKHLPGAHRLLAKKQTGAKEKFKTRQQRRLHSSENWQLRKSELVRRRFWSRKRGKSKKRQ